MKGVALFALLLLIPTVAAHSHYSYEHAESLKPLIEWRDYSPAAFSEAIDQNKPIFLLLTAPTWCYWCQVYESEEFLFHPQVIDMLNERFIPVYVDADQRQDLTRQWLEGGWPSTTVMAPNRERLYGFSGPRPVDNMVENLGRAADFVLTQGYANQVVYDYQEADPIVPTNDQLNQVVNSFAGHFLSLYDREQGGFGSGQKFPQGRVLDFSLELYELTNDNQWLELVQTTLRNQYTDINELESNYNLFDPVEGGFHRYGTRPDWSPPHYEKMLYDNARLLKAYYHLQLITPDDEIVQEVVTKTLDYVEQNYYDDELGGFAGNTDVHGEDHYYGQNPRPAEKPRVEKTKYSDWNADAIATYLYLWSQSGEEKYKDIAVNSLDFFAQEMVTENGAYHYRQPSGTKGVRGTLLDNAYLTWIFAEGYEVLEDPRYLAVARQLADFSLDNLYDWHSGGFFERNSQDLNLYAPGDNILLQKPNQENGVMALALVKLYVHTGDPVYLNAGLKTLGAKLQSTGTLDRGWHFVKAAQYVIQHDLTSEFGRHRLSVEARELEEQADFWLNPLIQGPESFEASTEGLEQLDAPLLLLIVIALFAGFVSFASPCSLPIVPAYVAYAFRSARYSIKGMTISFFLGLSAVFTLLGMSATAIGGFLRNQITVFSQIAGITIILFGVVLALGKGFSGMKFKRNKPNSYFGSFLFGAVFGVSWTPCVGPILVAILLLASTAGSVFSGGLLLFAYAVGLAVPLILISFYLERVNRESKLWKFIEGRQLHLTFGRKTYSFHSTSLISGVLFVILGYLIFSGILFSFNQYIAATSFQKWIFGIEEWVLGWLK